MASTLLRRAIGCSLALLTGASAGARAHAQESAPTLAQMAHRAWTIADGAPGAVNALAQTTDGYLWLGTGMGLYRFDGVRFEAFAPRPGEAMPSRTINTLHALPDGALWIGYTSGGASVLAGGRLVSYGERDGIPFSTLTAFARDSAGTMWAATVSEPGGLLRLVGGRWQRVGPESGYPGGTTADLLVDRRGTLWAAEVTGVYALPRGARRFERRAPPLVPDDVLAGSGGLREAPDGSVWAASAVRGLIPLSDASGGPPPGDVGASPDSGWRGLLIDRAGGAWRLYAGDTAFARVPLPTARSARRGGVAPLVRQTLPPRHRMAMSGTYVYAAMQDREGNVWVGTAGGIDQFRGAKFTRVDWPRPINDPAMVADDAGRVWVGGSDGALFEVGDGAVMHPRWAAYVRSTARDPDGGVWLAGESGLWYGRGGRFAPVPLPEEARGQLIQSVARDRDGVLWISVLFRGVFRRRDGAWERFVAPGVRLNSSARTVVADPAGRTWLGYSRDRLVLAAADTVRPFAERDGLRVDGVDWVHTRGDRVWVGGGAGVAYRDGDREGGRFRTLALAGGALHSVTGIVETAAGELWLNSDEGVVRVPAAELRRALRDTTYRARDQRFGLHDGVDGAPVHIRPLGTVLEGGDGRLWFATQTNVVWVDPTRLRGNPIPPPVHVRALTAGGRTYAAESAVVLPARTTALSVAYTGLSLAVPERVRFRYRLVGLDTAWQEAGTRREAFYTNLEPGRYRFEVLAANDDGVWSPAPAALAVVIPPTFVQTAGFRLLVVVAAGGVLWSLGAWRQRRVAAASRARFEAAVAERIRVARELHDTLLSDMTGVVMRLQGAAAAPAPVSSGVDVAVVADVARQARQALGEARRAVLDLRRSGDDLVSLGARLSDAARRIFADTDVEARVEHVGAERRYAPHVEAGVLRVASEAMTNARKHADCRVVVVTCTHGRNALAVRVWDDGRGFDAAPAAPAGHYGIAGMRERAAELGARLTVTSAPGRGTTVELTVPARPVG